MEARNSLIFTPNPNTENMLTENEDDTFRGDSMAFSNTTSMLYAINKSNGYKSDSS
jgi:hypothetical protein